jgi:putative phosphoesterase
MRIAFFSDIHANLPALEAFFRDVEQRKVDALYCLGDLVGYNIWPDEVIAEIRERGIPTIAGNHDSKVKKLKQDEHLEDVDYAYHIGSEQAREYLKTLPQFIKLQFTIAEEPIKVMLVHGSPRSINEYLLEELSEQYLKELLLESNADMLFCGHTHKPYHRLIPTSGKFKHVVNIGSVGKPKDGDPRGCYVILTLKENSTLVDTQSIAVDFIRFEYDVEMAAKAIEASPLPDEFAERLRKAH